MDETDRRLVEALRADARASYAQLARLVGLSAPSVQERVRRLERRGIITGYHAEVDLAAAGLAVTALVGVHQTDAAELADVAERLSTVTEVEDCFFVAGDNAFVVKVRVPDVAELESHDRPAPARRGGRPDPDDRGALDQVGASAGAAPGGSCRPGHATSTPIPVDAVDDAGSIEEVEERA